MEFDVNSMLLAYDAGAQDSSMKIGELEKRYGELCKLYAKKCRESRMHAAKRDEYRNALIATLYAQGGSSRAVIPHDAENYEIVKSKNVSDETIYMLHRKRG